MDGRPIDWLPKAPCPNGACSCDSPYRVVTGPFDITLPADNIITAIGTTFFEFIQGINTKLLVGVDLPAGVYHDFVSDGFYLLLDPLPPGRHTITWFGELYSGSSLDFGLNVTYSIWLN